MHQQGLSKESRVPTPTPPHSYIEDRVDGRLVATANGGSVCGRGGGIVESPPKRLTMVNRTVVRWLHDAVYPNASETPTTIKLRSILKSPEVTKILQGEKLTTESLWAGQTWQIPAVHMYGRLVYKFEGMTDMINGAFMGDLPELLNSATGDQRRRKTFYEIDTEFEKMTASLLKNFNSMASLMPFLRASLRQTMIRKLASVGKSGKDKDGWKKADHIGAP
jgi:hypothetical protein